MRHSPMNTDQGMARWRTVWFLPLALSVMLGSGGDVVAQESANAALQQEPQEVQSAQTAPESATAAGGAASAEAAAAAGRAEVERSQAAAGSETVRALYERGRALYDAGQYVEAREMFAEALRISQGETGGVSSGMAGAITGAAGSGTSAPTSAPTSALTMSSESPIRPVAAAQATQPSQTAGQLFVDVTTNWQHGAAVIREPADSSVSVTDGGGTIGIREVIRYRDRVKATLRDVDDHIGKLAKQEVALQQRWLQSSPPEEVVSKLDALREERRQLTNEQTYLRDLHQLLTTRLAGLYYNQGVDRTQSRQLDEAAEYFGLAADLAPNDVDIHYNRGVVLATLGEYRKAVESFDRASALTPEDADIHYNLGVLYDKYLDRPDVARAHYEAYLRLADEHAEERAVVQGWLNVVGRSYHN